MSNQVPNEDFTNAFKHVCRTKGIDPNSDPGKDKRDRVHKKFQSLENKDALYQNWNKLVEAIEECWWKWSFGRLEYTERMNVELMWVGCLSDPPFFITNNQTLSLIYLPQAPYKPTLTRLCFSSRLISIAFPQDS